jgi:uncharacterized membrane protein
LLELKYENKVLFGVISLFVILASFMLFGFIGLRTILGMIFILFLPFYFIFNNFDLSQAEKVTFSFFTSIMSFPSLVYWLGFIVPFKISIFITLSMLLIIAFLIAKFRRFIF